MPALISSCRFYFLLHMNLKIQHIRQQTDTAPSSVGSETGHFMLGCVVAGSSSMETIKYYIIWLEEVDARKEGD